MKRLWFVDNLRIFLISLVVLHHLSITYGAPGSWYYNESQPDGLLILPLAMFVATNQSFFMGLFFLISAYFTEVSLGRKGSRKFLSKRLLRLGVPLLLFFFLISPGMGYFLMKNLRDPDVSFLALFLEGDWFEVGPLWFVETLLFFTLIYFIWMKVSGKEPKHPSATRPLPRDRWILLLAVIIGLATFTVRIWLPVGWAIPLLNLQLPFFPQYLVLLVIGIIAARRGWLQQVTFRQGIRWFLLAQGMVFIVFPLLFLAGGAASGNVDAFMGGPTWQSLSYSLWEQVTGFSLMIGLLGIFREKLNYQGKLARQLSACAYGVFVLHAPVLVVLTVSLRNIDLPGLAKLVLLAPVAVAATFIVAYLIRKIPLMDRII